MKSIRDAIHAHYLSGFGPLGTVRANTLTQYANAPFEKPDPDAVLPPLWIRLFVLFGESFIAELGGNSSRHRFPGVVAVHILVPIDTGDGDALEVADLVVQHFRSRTVGGVTYRSAYPVAGIRDGAWWQTTVFCPFFADLSAG